MNLSQSLEDCLEAIYMEGSGKGVRINKLAEHLGIKPSSVNQTIKKLKEDALVSHEKYGKVELTEEGEEEAIKVFKRHKALEKFLREILKVGELQASKEACMMEHGLSTETQKKLTKFVEEFGGNTSDVGKN